MVSTRLWLSGLAADVLDGALRAGTPDVLAGYDGAALRARFRGRRVLRRGLDQVRTPARRILFGDRSFPVG